MSHPVEPHQQRLGLASCERGQLVVEYLLVSIGVVLPFGLLMNTLFTMTYLYFHRITGVVSLPFP